MKLNPSDIRHQEFKRAVRGFHPAEVSAFLEVVSEDYEELMAESRELRMKLRATEQQLDDLRARLKKSEDTAGILKSEIEKNKELLDAQMDAQLLKQKAEAEAQEILSGARKQAAELTRDIKLLEEQKTKVANYLRSYLRSQMTLLGIIEGDSAAPHPTPSNETTVADPEAGVHEDFEAAETEPADDVAETATEANTSLEQALESGDIDAFLDDVQLDEIPDELADALRRYDDETEDDRKRRILEDLDNLTKQSTGMFKKSDFHKMLGDDMHLKSEEMINRIYAALEKKKSPSKDKP